MTRTPATRLGILGGGQLGRMLALAAAPLGVWCRVLDPATEVPASVAAGVVTGAYEDPSSLDRFASGIDVATYEFENVPVAAAEHLALRLPVRPGATSLRVAQDRLEEKRFLRACGIATAPFAAVDSPDDAERAVAATGLPAILKTRRLGYDGKGQRAVAVVADVAAAHAELGGVPCLLEGVVSFSRELATLAARGTDGEVRHHAAVETRQRGGMLHTAVAPAPGLPPPTARALEAAHRALLEALDHVGVLAVEWFDTPGGPVAGEIAPRVHNSGHWTIEGSETSQFEQHVRAVCDLPLGDASTRLASGLVNLVGEPPDTAAVLAVPGAHLHLYGKTPRPGRKLGHVTVTGATEALRDERLAAVLAVSGPG